MIKNDKQYQVTKSRLNDFKESLQALDHEEAVDPLLRELHYGSLKSQIIEFEKQISEYELLKEGAINYVFVDNLTHIYEVLIKARIANGWTQANLAKRLHLKEQQIQRYEICNYSTASIERIIEIANALNVQIEKIKVKVREPQIPLPEGVDNFKLSQLKARKHLLVA